MIDMPLLAPSSVAVIGVSEDPKKLGSRVLRNLIANGFQGAIYGVGRCREAQGIACYPDASALPQAVDVAFLAVPAEAAVAVAQQCATRGVRSIVVGAAGFAEDGDADGVARQAALSRIARESGMRLLGPNCNGLYNPHADLSLGFNTAHGEQLQRGDIALLSHSGALFESMLRRFEALGAGLSTFVSLGNEADLDVLDLMAHQIEAPQTRVIALLIDALPDGERFAALASQAAAAGKPVVALKLGHSKVGAEAASAHSSRLVGDAAAYEALFERCGVAFIRTLEGFVTAAALLSRYGTRAGGLAAISSSGAGGALLADVAARHGVAMPQYDASTDERLGEFRRFSKLANPTDLGVFAGAVRHEVIVSAIAADPGIGAIVLQTHAVAGATKRSIEALASSQQATGKAHVLLAPGGLSKADLDIAAASGVIVMTDTDTAVQALGALLVTAPAAASLETLVAEPAPAVETLGEFDSLALLARYGAPTVPTALCASLDEALAKAEAFGWPIVLKSAAEGLAHKSDLGLVRVGVGGPDELRSAFAEMGAPSAVVVQPVIRGDLEIIVGLSYAKATGMTLIAGLGGIFAEALDQTVKWSLPCDRATIERRLRDSALGRVLTASRWPTPQTLADVVDVLMTLQTFAAASHGWLTAVDVNPLIATRRGLVAVDALVIGGRAPPAAR